LSDGAEGATVAVQDFGSGISRRHQQKIFELFYRVKDNDKQSYPGLGMGLYISKEIIGRHNGDIWVESTEGEGSTFYFTIPRLTPKSKQA
jgi:signal transduction histidine kinase